MKFISISYLNLNESTHFDESIFNYSEFIYDKEIILDTW